MPQLKEKTIKPERVVLEDGRKGYFINVPMTSGAIVVVKYPSAPRRKKTVGKTILAKRASQSDLSKSVIKALKEVKSRKATGDYPKDFDTLMDEL